jgi:hypothetical protein
MKEKKILFALKGLSIYELNSFSKYIHSPYFNVNKNISDYYDFLERHIKEGTADDLSNETSWKVVFKNEPYHNQRFLKLNSDLLSLLEDFIAQQEYESMTSLRACHKLAGAGKRNMTKLYNGILGDIGRLHKYEINQSSEFYLNKYMIEKNIFSLKTENEKKNEKFEIDSELNIQKISENLDIFYIAEKLRQFCSLLSWQKMYKLEITLFNIDSILEQSSRHPYSEYPAIKMYYTMVLTYIDENIIEHYYELKKLINEYIYLFPEYEQKEIYYTAISYCVNKVNKGDFSFQEETYLIYKETIEKNKLFLGGDLSPSDFRNVVFFALRVNEFDWTENFIHEYAEYLDPRYRDNAVEFSLARLEFYRKNYGKVLDHLNKVNYEDVWYNLNAKTLQLAAYYELDEYDALESLLQAYKMYIRREKSITPERKVHYLNLIKYTSSLMKVNPRDQAKILKIQEEISQTKGIVSKPWLMEKVNEMIRK